MHVCSIGYQWERNFQVLTHSRPMDCQCQGPGRVQLTLARSILYGSKLPRTTNLKNCCANCSTLCPEKSEPLNTFAITSAKLHRVKPDKYSTHTKRHPF